MTEAFLFTSKIGPVMGKTFLFINKPLAKSETVVRLFTLQKVEVYTAVHDLMLMAFEDKNVYFHIITINSISKEMYVKPGHNMHVAFFK